MTYFDKYSGQASDGGPVLIMTPGDRVLVFDPRLWIDDEKTPLSVTIKLATVVRCSERGIWPRVDKMIDVIFDHDGRLSKGHFTSGVKRETT